MVPRQGPVNPNDPDYALSAIVGREDKNGVVFQAQVIDRIEEFTHVGIRLCEHISKTSVSGSALKVGMGIDGFVGLRIREIGEKRLFGFSFAFDEIDGVVINFAVDRLALLAAIHFQPLRCFTSL